MKYYKIGIFILTLISTEIIFGQIKNDSLLYSCKNLKIFKNKAEFNNKEIYNAEKDLIKLKREEEVDDCPVSYNYYYNPLSLIGNYYSYEYGESGEYACGSPSNYLSIQTINLTNLEQISLTELFTKESIIEALKKDQWVVERAKEAKINLDTIHSLNDFIKTINNFDVTFKPSGFAILGLDKKTGLVAIRFVGTEYMGYNHNKHLQLGLRVMPKKDIIKLFKKDNHFYLGKFQNNLYYTMQKTNKHNKVNYAKVKLEMHKNTFQVGEPIIVNFLVKNSTKTTFEFCPWQTPLEKEFLADFFEIKYNGKIVPYNGKMVKRKPPTKDDNWVVKPKQTITQEINIKDGYNLDKPGAYTIRFLGRAINSLPDSKPISFTIHKKTINRQEAIKLAKQNYKIYANAVNPPRHFIVDAETGSIIRMNIEYSPNPKKMILDEYKAIYGKDRMNAEITVWEIVLKWTNKTTKITVEKVNFLKIKN